MTLGKIKRFRDEEGRTYGAEVDTGVKIDVVLFDMPTETYPTKRMRGTSLLYSMRQSSKDLTLVVYLGPGFFAGKDKVSGDRIRKRAAKALDDLRFKLTPQGMAYQATVREMTIDRPILMYELLLEMREDTPKKLRTFYQNSIKKYFTTISEMGDAARALSKPTETTSCSKKP